MSARLIAHQIIKNQNQTERSEVKYRETLLLSDDFTAKFLDQVRAAITNKNPSAGKFKPSDSDGPLQTRLKNYLESRTEEEFITFTKNAAKDLSKLMKLVSGATGGYVIFAEHEHSGETYILVALLSMKAQASFNEALDLTAAWVLDLEHLRHAARIHASEVTSNDDGVIQFVSREAGNTADYFIDFLGCEKVTDSSEQGKLLISALNTVCEELDIDLDEARTATHGYWQHCKNENKPMTLSALANLIRPEAPQQLLQALGRENLRLAGEFPPPPRKIMGSLVKFAYLTKSLKLVFDKKKWLGNVKATGSTVTIRNAPPQLITEINNAKSE